MNRLLLASKSVSRQWLLRQSNIPFRVIEQLACEQDCNWNLPLAQVVKDIALYKMESVIMPSADNLQDKSVSYVLTADTLTQDKQGAIYGKPENYAHAVTMLKASRLGSFVSTAFCLDKKIVLSGAWQTQERIVQVVSAECTFDVSDNWIKKYLEHVPSLDIAGAMAIENYGMQFLVSITGSYSTVIGLPLAQVRQALENLAFFE